MVIGKRSILLGMSVVSFAAFATEEEFPFYTGLESFLQNNVNAALEDKSSVSKAEVSSQIVYSEPAPISQQQEEDEIEACKSCFQFGANYSYLTLKPDGCPILQGSLGGLQALYEYKASNHFYAGVEFAWKEGSLHGSGGKRSILYFDVQERLGYSFFSSKKNWLLTLYSGFAYRYTGQNLKPKHGSSIKFNYNEFYVPVGMLAGYDINSTFNVGIDFAWMPQVFPTVSIVPLKGANWAITNQLKNFLVEVPLTFRLIENRCCFLILKPNYQHWQDGHSTAKASNGSSLGLPGNSYNFYGLDLNLLYCF
jgi:hypothetical protein